MLLADCLENGAGDFFPFQSFADGGFDAVIITQGQRARQRIAGMPFAHANLFLRRECHGAQLQSGPAQIPQRFLSDGASDRAGRQVKDALEFSLRPVALTAGNRTEMVLPMPVGAARNSLPPLANTR